MWEAFSGQTLYLDTNIFIFAIEPRNPWAAVLHDLFLAIDERSLHAITSELTIAEVLAKPLAAGALGLVTKYDHMLAENSIIDVIPITRQILRLSAKLRADLSVKLADAIHLATAKQAACNLVLTNDEKLGRKMETQFRWLSLSHFSVPPLSDRR